MGRPSNRDKRRQQILQAFARVLADHGYAGATIAAVAAEAELGLGLIHYHFKNKEELLTALLKMLVTGFKQRVREQRGDSDPLTAYADGALALGENSDVVAARCWVGLFAEAIRNPALFRRCRRLIDSEIVAIQSASGNKFTTHEASAVLAFTIGSLVMGAFAPRKTAGFAAPSLRRILAMFAGG
tara:strand:- start:88550 stop:89104 length:555 start_codon:yes stop_codon:yes gene_type:complete